MSDNINIPPEFSSAATLPSSPAIGSTGHASTSRTITLEEILSSPLFPVAIQMVAAYPHLAEQIITTSPESNSQASIVEISEEDSLTPEMQRDTVGGSQGLEPAEIEESSDANTSATPTKRQYRKVSDKLDIVNATIKDVGWTFGDYLYYASKDDLRDKNGREVYRSRSHIQTISQFLNGANRTGKTKTYGPIDIIRAWFESSYGRPGTENRDLMFSTMMLAETIHPARAAISTFAAELVEGRLVREMETAVKPSNGLHVVVSSKKGKGTMQWKNIGANTLPKVKKTFKKHTPLAFHLLSKMAARPPRKLNGHAIVRKKRPVDDIVAHMLSSAAYSRTQRAKLLQMMRGVVYLASGAHSDLYRLNNRVGLLPSYTTIRQSLVDASKQEALTVEELGRSNTEWLMLRTDNVQYYSKLWEPSMGREAKMIKGMAATAVKMVDFDPKAWDLDDKLQRVAKNERRFVDVDWFLGLIDQHHIEVVKVLQWLQTLVRHVPELHHHRQHVNELYKTRAAKCLPAECKKTEIYPLAVTKKDENLTTELRDAIVEFLGQLGQKEGNYVRRLILAGGDGLTYKKFVQIKKYLQFHPDDLQRLAVIEPLLELWHLEWTDLSRLFQMHWGESSPKDPSALGHSAAAIGQKAPSDLSKVDYYPAARLAYLVLDARVLDCWRIYYQADDLFEHFKALGDQDQLPSFEMLEGVALHLHRTYTTSRAYTRAMSAAEREVDPVYQAPEGSSWTPATIAVSNSSSSSQNDQPVTTTSTPDRPSEARVSGHGRNEGTESFTGDHALACSIRFMDDAMISREVAYAVAVGDTGRVYEGIKCMLFTFAGSTHTKYVTYLLELITSLELECSESLRIAIFKNWVVNLSGLPGHYTEGDLMQEHLNKALEELLQRKDLGFDSPFVKDVISRNLHHLNRIPKEMEEALKLKPRSRGHTSPHMRPELRRLLRDCRQMQLHYWRRGRIYGRPDVDQFSHGYAYLEKKIEKWKHETVEDRGLAALQTDCAGPAKNPRPTSDSENEDEEDVEAPRLTRGFKRMVDGDLTIDFDGMESEGDNNCAVLPGDNDNQVDVDQTELSDNEDRE